MFRSIIKQSIVIGLMLTTFSAQTFVSISQARQYASQHEEFPQTDNDNLLMPSYERFYRENRPTLLGRIAEFLHLKEQPIWNVELFKKTAEQLTSERIQNAYFARFVEKIIPSSEAKIIVLGDLHGAFHSLVRDLEELKRQNLILDDFTLASTDIYIVFNGNVIDLSPYILETLTLVMNIMLANPHNAFYIRGKHEDKEYWKDYGLRQELELRAAHLSNEKIPLESLLKKFFGTLPLALYLIHPEGTMYNAIRISPTSKKTSEFNADEFGNFFADDSKKPDIYQIANKIPSTVPFTIKAIIKADERSTTFTPSKGLLNVEPDEGATAWTVLSSPIRTNRTLYEFFFDAFAIIETGPSIYNWTISLYNRDIRDVLDFTVSRIFNLVSGQELFTTAQKKRQTSDLSQQIEQLKQEKRSLLEELKMCAQRYTKQGSSSNENESGDIVIGTTLDLSRFYKGESTDTLEGMQTAFEVANKHGGIRGRKLKLIALDDEYDGTKARENINVLKNKFGASILLSPMESGPLTEIMDLIEEKKILVLFPDTGALSTRNNNLSHLIYYRGAYPTIYTKLLSFAKHQLKFKKFAIFYINDQSTVGLDQSIKDAGIDETQILKLPHNLSDATFTQQAELIKNFNPDAIALFSSSRMAEGLLTSLGAANLINTFLLGVELTDANFKNFLASQGLTGRFIDTQNIPNPHTSPMELFQEFRKEWKDSSKINSYNATGYVVASIFIDALKRTEGPLTNENIIATLEQTKQYNLKGLPLNFDPRHRELAPYVWLDTGKRDWFEIPLQEQVVPDTVSVQQQNKTTQDIHKSMDNTQEIIIGSTMDLSKSMGQQGQETRFGLYKAIEKANREGGINGQRIRLVILDDENEQDIARKNVEKLMTEYHTDIIISPLEIVTIQGFMDYLQKNKVGLLFPCTGSPILFDETLTSVVNLRPSYTDVDITTILYAREKWRAQRIAYLASQDEVNQGLEKHIALTGIPTSDYKIFFQNPSSTEFKPIIQELLKFAPDVIVLFTLPQSSVEFLRQMGSEKLLGIKIIGNEFAQESFEQFIKDQGLEQQYIDIENFPNPLASTLEIMQEYRKEIGNAKPNTFSMEGYIHGALFVDLARRTQGAINKDSIIKTAEQTKNYNFKGLTLNFNPKTRQLYDTIWIATINKKEWQPSELNTKKYTHLSIPEPQTIGTQP